MEPLEKQEYKGYTIEVHQDDDPQNPITEFDDTVKYACLHNRYDLGNVELKSVEEVDEHLKETRAIAYPLYLMDHSGLSLSIDASRFSACDSAGWDWGMLGYVFMEREDILNEYTVKILTKNVKELVRTRLQHSVETYSAYLGGSVYGFILDKEDDKGLASCWGFYDMDDCLSEARADVDYREAARLCEEAKEFRLRKDRHAFRLKQQIRHRAPLRCRVPFDMGG